MTTVTVQAEIAAAMKPPATTMATVAYALQAVLGHCPPFEAVDAESGIWNVEVSEANAATLEAEGVLDLSNGAARLFAEMP